MVLDGVMVIVACTALTILHPGTVFGRQGWRASRFSLGGRKSAFREARVESGSVSMGDGKGVGDVSETEMN